MNHKSNWRNDAICAFDKHHYRWLSYKISDVEYAKEGCSRCKVKTQCLLSALKNDAFVGVIAGMSEYDFLLKTWQAITEENESNWTGDSGLFQRLLQETE